MKRRRWTQLKSSSRTSSRRSRGDGRARDPEGRSPPAGARFFCPKGKALTGGIALLILLLTPLSASAQSVELTAHRGTDRVQAGVTLVWNRNAELLASLMDGLESRITFTVRLYEKRPMPFQLLGERMAAETSRAQGAFYDFLDRKFVVEGEDGKRRLYSKAEDFLRDFFSWSDIMLTGRGAEDAYVTARVQFDPVRLMPPLTIVTLVGGTETYMSPWVREEVEK